MMSASIRPGLLILIVFAVGALWPQAHPAHASGASSIGLGRSHSCIVSGLGDIQCWGLNASGQLGNGISGSTEPNPLPVQVLEEPGGSPVSGALRVASGAEHTCALIEGGSVQCWGKNSLGQLGDDGACGTACPTPVPVSGLDSGVLAIAAGDSHTCVVMDTGGVKCWGLNHFGQLGVEGGDPCIVGPCSRTPVNVTGLTSNATSIDAGLEHSCVVTVAGGIQCWGKNHLGQLGDGTANVRVGAVRVCAAYDESAGSCTELLSGASAVSLGWFHTCALIGAGAKCWGGGEFGQLGDGSCCATGLHSTAPVVPTGLATEVSALAAGRDHTCAAMDDESIRCWGMNHEGQLGATSQETCTIFACSTTPIGVVGLGGAFALDAGDSHGCAATAGEGLLCWGLNDDGQLGDGTTGQRTVPAPVLLDSDHDGCLDATELQSATGSEADGGLRNPKSFWDFFDVPTGLPFARNKSVDIADIGAVVAHFGATREPAPSKEEALAKALTTPIDLTTYHPAYDRSRQGPSVWNSGPPDGTISIQDIGLVVAQFGHDCIAS